MGPLINRQQLDIVSGLVAHALDNGATGASGGAPIDRAVYFNAPAILSGGTDGVRIADEEQFRPALAVIKFTDAQEAIVSANRGKYGLTASEWSADAARASSFPSVIDTRQVSINVQGGAVRPDLPFGGHKWSGIGVENGPPGLNGFTELQVISRPARCQARAS